MRVGWNTDREVEGVWFPFWLGVADHDFTTRRVLVLPVPVNFLYAFGMWTWLHVKFPRFQDEIERRVAREKDTIAAEAYHRGFAEGVKVGQDRQKFEMGRFFDKSLAEMRAR